jgi:hypothetical protein
VRRGLVAALSVGLVVVAALVAVEHAVRLSPRSAPLDAREAQAALARLRRAVVGEGAPGSDDALLVRPRPTLLYATAWSGGRPSRRARGEGPTLAAAIDDAARRLAASPPLPQSPESPESPEVRYKLDLLVAEGPLPAVPEPLRSASLVPGRDGVAATSDGARADLLPDDLLADGLYARPLSGAFARALAGADLELGADLPAIRRRLARALPGHPSLRRTRWDQWIEPAAARTPPLSVERGHLARTPERSHDALVAAARLGGDYLLSHLHPDGRFDYEYYPDADQAPPADEHSYSLARHAGAALFLADLAAATRDRRYLDGAARALAWLATQHPPGVAGVAAPSDRSIALGATALASVAASAHQRAAAALGLPIDDAQSAWAAALARHLVAQQLPSGDFAHFYVLDKNDGPGRRDETTRVLYASGEAALALAARARAVPAEAAALAPAVERALTALVTANDRAFATQFFFVEDHWTCIAADAGWGLLSPPTRARAARYCADFAAFLRRSQHRADDALGRADPDLVGAYGVTPLLAAHPTPVGSRTEALLATRQMALRLGHDTRALDAMIDDGLAFLLRHQLTDDALYWAPSPSAARGGLLLSDVGRRVRIDFVQHAGAALLRGAKEVW